MNIWTQVGLSSINRICSPKVLMIHPPGELDQTSWHTEPLRDYANYALAHPRWIFFGCLSLPSFGRLGLHGVASRELVINYSSLQSNIHIGAIIGLYVPRPCKEPSHRKSTFVERRRYRHSWVHSWIPYLVGWVEWAVDDPWVI